MEIQDQYDNPDYASNPLVTITAPVVDGSSGSMNDWGSWARNVGGTIITGALDVYKIKTIGGASGVPGVDPRTGRPYIEGQRTVTPGAVSVGGMSVSPMLLIGGAVAVAALLLLRK